MNADSVLTVLLRRPKPAQIALTHHRSAPKKSLQSVRKIYAVDLHQTKQDTSALPLAWAVGLGEATTLPQP